MTSFKCKICGGTLEIEENQLIAECEYCGTKQTLPQLDDERKANLFDRANHFRRCNEFDKAMAIYEQILNEDHNDAECYWSLVLCKYGIEYVEDPVIHKRIPTVNRTQYTSIFADENYIAALEHANGSQKVLYEEEAKTIDEIQKGILKISSQEKPFDVFICYKESDENDERTSDSVLAQDIYYQLVSKGFKVFFARITLESKLGQQYEPYIFAALNSAKVMIIVGTKPEYYNAVWVKNEWSRFLKIAHENRDRLIIPAYKNMDPYDMPDALSYYQALDMSKIGFIQDLVHGIDKIVKGNIEKEIDVGKNKSNLSALIKRGNMAMEDGEWDRAFEYFDQVLNMDAECAEAYLGQALSKYKANNEDVFINHILESTQQVEKKEHLLAKLQAYYNEKVEELMNVGINIPQEYSDLPIITYYTEQEGRLQQLEKARNDFNEDKLISKAIRFNNGGSIFGKVEENLFGIMQKRVDDAIKQDAIRQAEVEENAHIWEEEFKAFVMQKLQELEEANRKEYEEAKERLESGQVVILKDMRNKFNRLGDYGNAKKIAEELTNMTEEYERKRDALREEYRELIDAFSTVKKGFFGKSKKYKTLEEQLKKVSDQLDIINECLR